MVVAVASDNELIVVLIYIPADSFHLSEIKRRAGDISYLAGRYAVLINGSVARRGQTKLLREHVRTLIRAEIEIRVISHVYRRILGADSFICNRKLVAVIKSISHLCAHRAGESVRALVALIFENKALALDFCRPDSVRKLAAAMQAGLAVLVLYNINFFAVNGKMSAADAISISADDLTLIVRTLDMTLEIVEADDNILEIAVSVGRKKRLPGCAVCNDGRTDAVCVLELVYIDLFAVGKSAEKFL